jgi:alkylhydroperoxidase family enzyme
MDINSSRGMSRGLPYAKLQLLEQFRDSPQFSAAERAALAFAEAVTATPTAVTDEVFATLRDHYTVAEIVELAATIAVEHFRAKFNTALGIPAQGLCVLPPR